MLTTIIIIGFSGLIAQVLILRELLVSFCGNEFILGIALGNWVVAEALGVFFAGNYIDRSKVKEDALIVLQLVFSLILPVSIFLSRTFKSISGIPAA